MAGQIVFDSFTGEGLDIVNVQNFYVHSSCGNRLVRYKGQKNNFPQYCHSCRDYCLNESEAMHNFSASIIFPLGENFVEL